MAAHRSLLILVFANLVLFGAGVSLLGATMPTIIRELSWSYMEMGSVLAVGSLLQAGLGWRHMYVSVGATCAAAALAFALVDFGEAGQRPPATGSASSALASLARHPLLLLLCLVVLLYVGAEMGVASWVGEYFVEVHGLTAATAAYSVSVYWGGLLCGRFLAWAAYHGHRQHYFLLALSVTAALGVCLALVIGTPLLAMALIFISGLGYSCVYPVVMTIAGLRFTEEQSLAVGAVSTAGGLGSLACPFIMSGIAEHFGVATGFWFYGAVTVAMALAALVVALLVRREGPRLGIAPEAAAPPIEVVP